MYGHLVYFILKVLAWESCNMKWGFAKKIIISLKDSLCMVFIFIDQMLFQFESSLKIVTKLHMMLWQILESESWYWPWVFIRASYAFFFIFLENFMLLKIVFSRLIFLKWYDRKSKYNILHNFICIRWIWIPIGFIKAKDQSRYKGSLLIVQFHLVQSLV